MHRKSILLIIIFKNIKTPKSAKNTITDVSQFKRELNKIKKDFKAFSSKLEIPDINFVPLSALHGDNVVDRSKKMDWLS